MCGESDAWIVVCVWESWYMYNFEYNIRINMTYLARAREVKILIYPMEDSMLKRHVDYSSVKCDGVS